MQPNHLSILIGEEHRRDLQRRAEQYRLVARGHRRHAPAIRRTIGRTAMSIGERLLD
ncbi:MAG TPA: hypothetical protein VHT30_01660 [Acidimicrobiales bacterium]|jgi:hypothetical protein|nr:hypothetical protein [Acidimicrobiales bacterium]